MTTQEAKQFFKSKVPVIYNGKKYRIVGLSSYINEREQIINQICIRGLKGEGNYWIKADDVQEEL